MRQSLVKLVLLLLVTVAFLSVAGQAMAENKYMPKPSKWGPDDQIGNANYLTPKKVMEAVKLVKEGKVFDLGNEYYKGFPAYPRDVFVWLLVHGLTVDPRAATTRPRTWRNSWPCPPACPPSWTASPT